MDITDIAQHTLQSALIFFMNGKYWGLHYYGLGIISSVILLRLLIGKPSHAIRIVYSYWALWKVKRCGESNDQFGYLRGLDPFVFEELVLTALKKHGFKIKRNRRYTGDGGIDGQCWWKGQRYLIQAKRYKGNIRVQDVQALRVLCRKKKSKGLFIHTGSTPSAAYQELGGLVQIISDDRLVELLGAGNALK